MASVGERLRHERESRDTTIEQLAEATGIGLTYLEAMENNDFDALPGPAFGKLYVRAYAEILSFDPKPLIDDYDRERRLLQRDAAAPPGPEPVGSRPVAAAIARWKAARAAERTGRAVEADALEHESPSEEPDGPSEASPNAAVDAVIPETHERTSTARRFLAPLLLVGVAAIASGIYFGMRGTGGGHPLVRPGPESRPTEPPPSVTAESQLPPLPPARRIVRETTAGPLTVVEFGVGRRVVSLTLEGEGERFPAGTVVSFATRVLGGKAGDRIRHVWLHEGRVRQSIRLRLGGPDFRTHSNRTLGEVGAWAVEARDESDHVLARSTFDCTSVDR